MRAYLDFGNTRVKVRIEDEVTSVGYAGASDESFISVDEVVLCSVIEEEIVKPFVETYFPNANRVYKAIVSDLEVLTCNYAEPRKLGVDRWVAAVSAVHSYGDALVVDAGTAITIDLVEAGEFKGGLILPGLHLMKSSLMASAALINSAAEDSSLNLGTDTASAVANGAFYGAVGAIQRVASQFSVTRIVFTGGNGAILAAGVGSGAVENIVDSDLVLSGLRYVELERIK